MTLGTVHLTLYIVFHFISGNHALILYFNNIEAISPNEGLRHYRTNYPRWKQNQRYNSIFNIHMTTLATLLLAVKRIGSRSELTYIYIHSISTYKRKKRKLYVYDETWKDFQYLISKLYTYDIQLKQQKKPQNKTNYSLQKVKKKKRSNA